MNMMTIDRPLERTYSISELCKEFELTPRALRFYEQKKLLAPARRGLTRLFSANDRARLKLMVRAKRARFTLSEIKEMLDRHDKSDGQSGHLYLPLPRLTDQLEYLRAEYTELTGAIAELERCCNEADETQAQ